MQPPAPKLSEQDVIESFKNAMGQHGLIPPATLVADGRIHRCDAEGKRGKSDGSYKLHLDDYPAGGFENHRDCQGWKNWCYGRRQALSPAEKAAYRQRLDAEQKKREAEKAQIQEAVASASLQIWQALKEDGTSPYLTRKGVPAYGLRFDGDTLIIPLRDAAGKLWSLQTILPDGSKRFTKGGRKKGCFHTIGTLQGASIAYVVEGYATGASVHLATQKPVIVAFDADNLEPVIAAIRKIHPDLAITIAADDDRWPSEATGKASHKGEHKARDAAKKYRCNVILPRFSKQHLAEAIS